jgi:hypothetical protein
VQHALADLGGRRVEIFGRLLGEGFTLGTVATTVPLEPRDRLRQLPPDAMLAQQLEQLVTLVVVVRHTLHFPVVASVQPSEDLT